MNKKPTFREQFFAWVSGPQKLWDRLTAPSKAVVKTDEQRVARLAASFLLAISLLTLSGILIRTARMSLMESFIGPLGFSMITCIILYVISRTKWYRAGIFIFSLIFGGLAYVTMAAQGQQADVGGLVLIYVPLSLIVASAFLSGWAVWLLTGLNVGALFTLVKSGTIHQPDNIGAQLGIITTIGLALILLTNFRKGVENTRLAQIQEANKALEESRDNLEQHVIERTAAAEEARAQAEAARQEAETARRDMETQIWLVTGQTQLAEVMRGEQDIPQLAEHVSAQICQYIGAQAGALYLLDGKTLTIKGRYALAERPGFDGKFQIGEGLAGQAAADGKVMYWDAIPADALLISTGLVEMQPRQVAAAPFYANGEVVGVLELATLSKFTPMHLELWGRISESIGVAFRTAQTRQKLSAVLMETQQQAEELQAQEEELRAANEELMAQAENMKFASSKKGSKHE